MSLKTKLPEYWAWSRMKQRCFDKNTLEFKHYGGRGITVCHRWMKFENFYADMGARPKGMTLERIDRDGNYAPENCKWATRREQVLNRAMTRWITHNGETLCLSDWAKKCGIHKTVLTYRLNAGWDVSRALSK